MKSWHVPQGAARWVLLVLIAASALGCSKKLTSLIIANRLPEVRITSAPIDSLATCDPDPIRSCYAINVNWVGHDPDGRVDHYLYSVDPPTVAGLDTVWQLTRTNEVRVVLTANRRDQQNDRLFEEPHTFVLKAVDNRGAPGPVIDRSFYSFTEAPSVQIENPPPSSLIVPLVPPSIRIRWSGRDPDGVFTNKPVRYKYILLTPSTLITADVATRNPDTLRTVYAPTFEGWQETSADTTEIQFTNLNPDQTYMFVVVAFDEAGAYSPVFSLTRNMLRFKVGFAGTQGPIITFFNEFFNYSYLAGGYCVCPEIEVFLELPADREITMNWFADPPEGATIASYRWALDIGDNIDDDTPRDDEERDITRWSARALSTTSARLGPFAGGEEHRLYVEAVDNVGLRSLGVVRFVVVQSDLGKPLLIVDDTRLTTDKKLSNGCYDRPKGGWPNAAEFDTFMFARGNVPWLPQNCGTTSYPTGTQSTPGIFNGYPFDTLGTRNGLADASVRLATLGKYAHVIWITDANGALFNLGGNNSSEPTTALRYMSLAGRVNSMGAYIKQGGKVWTMGGGIALATNGPWDDRNNNPQTYVLYATSGLRRELAPGRFMYDLTHWQSGIGVAKQITTVEKYLGRYRSRSDPANPWTAYRDELPEMRKLDNSDPLPPLRTSTDYRIASIPLEYIVQENIIIEDVNPDQDILDEQSTLDTLYQLNANAQPRDVGTKAVMTYYHGPAIPQGFLFTGFAPWNFKRSSCQALVDFVLQRMWGLSRSATPHFRAAATEQVRPPAMLTRTPSGQALTPSEVARRVRTHARSTSVPRH